MAVVMVVGDGAVVAVGIFVMVVVEVVAVASWHYLDAWWWLVVATVDDSSDGGCR